MKILLIAMICGLTACIGTDKPLNVLNFKGVYSKNNPQELQQLIIENNSDQPLFVFLNNTSFSIYDDKLGKYFPELGDFQDQPLRVQLILPKLGSGIHRYAILNLKNFVETNGKYAMDVFYLYAKDLNMEKFSLKYLDNLSLKVNNQTFYWEISNAPLLHKKDSSPDTLDLSDCFTK